MIKRAVRKMYGKDDKEKTVIASEDEFDHIYSDNEGDG